MKIKILTLEFSRLLKGFDCLPLEQFAADKTIRQVESSFFTEDQRHYLTLVIQYDGLPESRPQEPRKQFSPRSYPDPKQSLTSEELPLFETLREWRKAQSEREGIPHYIVLKNQQLVDLVKQRPTTLAQLQTISGIGSAKSAKYGEALLTLLRKEPENA
ncbi:HRDC domain-containing protein [Deltaproteobacteria bacterium TL4]